MIGVVSTTFNRPHAIQRFVRSVRHVLGSIPIYVADQSEPSNEMIEFYRFHGVVCTWPGYNVGVAAARNSAVSLVQEEYFLLCDDDFILTERAGIWFAASILKERRNIGVIGGSLIDVAAKDKEVHKWFRSWELYINLDSKNRILTTIPIQWFNPISECLGMAVYYYSDAVMNFALFRTEIFSRSKMFWDPQFQCNGEHEDFYLRIKTETPYDVVYFPRMQAEHHHPPLQAYGRQRQNNEGWALFLRKWGLEQFYEIGTGLRTSRDLDLKKPQWSGADAPHRTDKREVDIAHTRNGVTILHSCDESGVGEVGNDQKYAVVGIDANGLHTRGFTELRCQREYSREINNDFEIWQEYSSLDEIEISVPDVDEQLEDLVIFLKPLAGREMVSSFLSFDNFRYSIRRGDDFICHSEKLVLYGNRYEWNVWNGFVVSVPRVGGVLTLDLLLERSDVEEMLLLGSAEFSVAIK